MAQAKERAQNPLQCGCSNATISANIRELRHAGVKQSAAVARALDHNRRQGCPYPIPKTPARAANPKAAKKCVNGYYVVVGPKWTGTHIHFPEHLPPPLPGLGLDAAHEALAAKAKSTGGEVHLLRVKSTCAFTCVASADGARQANPVSTRFIGFCAACERRIKVRDKRLVHHGYERPGHGYIVGDCYGVDRAPHELSDAVAVGFLTQVIQPTLRHWEARATFLGEEPHQPPTLDFALTDPENRWGPAKGPLGNVKTAPRTFAQMSSNRELDPALYAAGYSTNRHLWNGILKQERSKALAHLADLKREETRLTTLISTWKLLPLETVEEEMAQKREAKAARETKLATERDAKLAAALDSLLKRIDSAVKNRNPHSLEDLFENGYRKPREVSKYTLSRQEILRRLDRDHVWRAFGLLRDDGAYLGGDSPSVDRDILQAMSPWTTWGRHHLDSSEPAPWPAALGGGKTKKR